MKFDLRGREYNGQYYVDLNAWRIEQETKLAEPTPVDERCGQCGSDAPRASHARHCAGGRRRPPVLTLHDGPISTSNLERALDVRPGLSALVASPFTIAVILTVVAALMALRQASPSECWMRGRQAFGMPA